MPANRTGSNPFQDLLARRGSSYQTSPVMLHLKTARRYSHEGIDEKLEVLNYCSLIC
jgi:hypothetical protein